MKTMLQCLIILAFIVGCSAYAFAADQLRVTVDRKTFLKAIDQVESGGRDRARGAAGERSRYQLTESVWKQYTATPFRFAHRRDLAAAIAEQHFDWIIGCLLSADLPADVEHVALCWNAGVSAVRNNRLLPVHHDYAARVGNLYVDFKKGGAS